MGPTFGKAGDRSLAQGTLAVLAMLGAGRGLLALHWLWQHHGSDCALQAADAHDCGNLGSCTWSFSPSLDCQGMGAE